MTAQDKVIIKLRKLQVMWNYASLPGAVQSKGDFQMPHASIAKSVALLCGRRRIELFLADISHVL